MVLGQTSIARLAVAKYPLDVEDPGLAAAASQQRGLCAPAQQQDVEPQSATTSFQLEVETLYNSRLPQVDKQWLARFGRTVSSQVVESITNRMGRDGGSSTVVLSGQSINLSGDAAESGDGLDDLNGEDPLALLKPRTKEQLEDEPVTASPTMRELLTGSSFRLSLNPGNSEADGNGNGAKGVGAASGATTASGGGGRGGWDAPGDWTLWGEAAVTSFSGEDGDLSIDGEVLTGVAAIDWQKDRWLLGLAVSQSDGDGSFEAPQTDMDDAVKGTVRSSLTAIYPYTRFRPGPGMEFWGMAGYGRGTMTLDAEDEDPANPDIWLTTIVVGGRAALLPPQQTGGPALDLTADALLTRTGAATDLPLRDAVEATTTRLRLGLETSWIWKGENGTSLKPTLSTALRYDGGDVETGFGLEVGAGITYANADRSLLLSLNGRGFLSNQDGIGFEEWGGSGSIQFDPGADKMGLTIALSPSWGVSGSRADQLWCEVTPPFANADGATNGNARLESEIGYGFAVFSDNGTITPYAGLDLDDGSRNWRLGTRLSFSSALDINIEGTRREPSDDKLEYGTRLVVTSACFAVPGWPLT